MRRPSATAAASSPTRRSPPSAPPGCAPTARRPPTSPPPCATSTSSPRSGRVDLLERHAYECYLISQPQRASESQRRALAEHEAAGDRLRQGDAHRWLSRLAWFSGDGPTAETEARLAIELLEPLGPTTELAMAYSNRSQLCMLADDLVGARDWGGRAIALAERLDAPDILAHALNNVGSAEANAGSGRAWPRWSGVSASPRPTASRSMSRGRSPTSPARPWRCTTSTRGSAGATRRSTTAPTTISTPGASTRPGGGHGRTWSAAAGTWPCAMRRPSLETPSLAPTRGQHPGGARTDPRSPRRRRPLGDARRGPVRGDEDRRAPAAAPRGRGPRGGAAAGGQARPGGGRDRPGPRPGARPRAGAVDGRGARLATSGRPHRPAVRRAAGAVGARARRAAP